MELTDYPSSVLTPRQREILLGDEDITARANRSARSRIRERLWASIYDFSLIQRELPLKDIDRAFTEPEDFDIGQQDTLAVVMPDVIALLYLANRDAETTPGVSHEGWHTEYLVETGIKRALSRLGDSFENVEVDISVERGEPLDKIADKDLSDLSVDILKQLLLAGEIDNQQFIDAIRGDADN